MAIASKQDVMFPWQSRGEHIVIQNPSGMVTHSDGYGGSSREPSNAASGRRFLVIVLRRGDRYGLNDKLVHDEDEPSIEVWDLTHANTKGFDQRGQFVSRYYAFSIAERGGSRGGSRGIDLMGYEPAWKIADFSPAVALAKRVTLGEAAWKKAQAAKYARESQQPEPSYSAPRPRRTRKRGTARRTADRCRSTSTGRFKRC